MSSFQVDGVNLLRVPAKDVNAYGQALLDLLFTKQEQKTSIVMKSKKSNKPPLDPARVEKMFGKISSDIVGALKLMTVFFFLQLVYSEDMETHTATQN